MGVLRPFIIVLVLFAQISRVSAQDSLYSADPNAVKKILLHLDKASYYAGDTMFFKAYLYSDYNPDLSATNLIAALYDDRGKKIAEKRFPVFGGCSFGNFEWKDSSAHGLYYFQAITPEQLMRKDSVGYIRRVFVFNPRQVPTHLTEKISPEYSIRFFPQGGQLIEGVGNQVLFTATDQFGNPLSLKGKLLDDKQELLAEIEAINGKGSFFLFPEERSYSTSFRLPGFEKEIQFALPAVVYSGAVFRIEENGNEKKYLIEIPEGTDKAHLMLLGVMNEKQVFQIPLKAAGNNFSGIIPGTKLLSGTLFMAIRDGNGNILAENHCLVDNREYQRGVELILDSIDLRTGGINVMTIDLKDSLLASLSLSVTDPSLAEAIYGIGSNIIEDALYNNDKLGTNGDQRKIKWSSIFSDGSGQQPVAENFINVRGKVYKESSNKLIREGQLNFMVTTRDSTKSFLFASVDTSGRFQLNNMVYADTARFGFVLTKPNGKSGAVSIRLDQAPYQMPAKLPLTLSLPYYLYDRISLTDPGQRGLLISRHDSLIRSNDQYKLMEEAVVVANVRKRNPLLLVNEQYTSGLFSAMGMTRVMDLINEPPTVGGNIFDYISSKMAGVRVTRTGGFDYTISSNRSPSLMAMMNGQQPEPIFFLNERQVTSMELTVIPLSEIALVKYFPPGTHQMAFSNLSPILAVYTKKDSDLYSGDGPMNEFRYPGYNNSDLSMDDDYNQYHQGRTGSIYWKPDLFLSGEGSRITVRFLNPKATGSFHILLQGVTRDGELIYLERTISTK